MPERLLELQHRLIDLRDELQAAGLRPLVTEITDWDFELLADAAMVLHDQLYKGDPTPTHGDWVPKKYRVDG